MSKDAKTTRTKSSASNGEAAGASKGRAIGLAIGGIFALIAALLVYQYNQNLAEQYGQAGKLVNVLIAAKDIDRGTVIDKTMLRQKKIPESYKHPQAIEKDSYQDVIGSQPIHDLKSNQPLLWSDFTGAASNVELSQVVQEGWRALAIPVDRVTSISGLIQPGDHVDIVGTFKKPEKNSFGTTRVGEYDIPTFDLGGGEMMTLTILQNVTVLAVGDTVGATSGQGAQYDTVTIHVTPEEAELLIFAQAQGKLAIVLRNENDVTDESNIAGKNWSDLFEEEKREAMHQKGATRRAKSKKLIIR